MASGIKVAERVKTIFQEMKVHRCDDDATKRLRIVTFTIQGEFIDVDKEIHEYDLSECDAFQKFGELLRDGECFYFLYDCHFENKEGIKKEEMIFGSWIPDSSVIKLRMSYAASRSSIKNIMKGIKHDIQMNDKADVKSREEFGRTLDKDPVASIEGKSC